MTWARQVSRTVRLEMHTKFSLENLKGKKIGTLTRRWEVIRIYVGATEWRLCWRDGAMNVRGMNMLATRTAGVQGRPVECLLSFLHVHIKQTNKQTNKQTLWILVASELYRSSDRRLSTKLVPIFADRGCRVVSATYSQGRLISVFQTGAATFPFK
jgi:hypothetical protein